MNKTQLPYPKIRLSHLLKYQDTFLPRYINQAMAMTFALVVFFLFIMVFGSPRGRQNFVQVLSAIFYIVVLARCFLSLEAPGGEVRNKVRPFHRVIFAILASMGFYVTMVSSLFVSDDFRNIYDIAHQPFWNYLWSNLTVGQVGTFLRPLGFVSLHLDYNIWRWWPWGYHLTNLLLHSIALVGLFCLCRKLGLSKDIAATAVLVFAVIPIQAEAVGWVSARFDLLAGCASVWALVMYFSYRRSGRKWQYLASLVNSGLAIFSKESAYAIPLLIIAAEFFLKTKTERRFKPLIGFLGLAAAAFGYRWWVLGGIGGYLNPAGQPEAFSLNLQGIFLRGPALLLFGFNLEHQDVYGTVLILSGTIGALFLLSYAFRLDPFKKRVILFFLAWGLLANLPAQFLLFINPGLTNSRVLYLGALGTAALLAVLLHGTPHQPVRRFCALTLLVFYGLGLWHNLDVWRHAGLMSRSILVELERIEPSPPPGTEFIFRRMPDQLQGAFFYRNGLPEAIRHAYGREDLWARRETDAASKPPDLNHFPRQPIYIEFINSVQTPIRLTEMQPR